MNTDTTSPHGRGAAASVSAPLRHFRRPVERPFLRAAREDVTLLVGGLTVRHDRLIQAALQGLGHRVELVPVPTKGDFQAGREFGNNGQCNPTYFTVGALINVLRRLRDEQGVPTERILDDYVFVTFGSCGPCRFGMYESEYRLALANSGFDGFRVLVLSQDAGLLPGAGEAGLQTGAPFILALLDAILMGDLLNAVANHIRPYESVAGRTDAVFDQCLAVCEAALRSPRLPTPKGGWMVDAIARTFSLDRANAAALLARGRDTRIQTALATCRRIIDEGIEVDYTRAKPLVKITGEFWAQTTEGDGNFRMFDFLENEGAEILVEPVTTWLDYTLHYWRQHTVDRRGLTTRAALPRWWQLGARLTRWFGHRRALVVLWLGRKLLAREYERMRAALGGTSHALADQFELQRVGHPYYNSRASGGEGHLEVAKNIYCFNRRLAHLVLSLKPFGCMPSTQSDGAQAAVLAHYPDMLFLPVETSGEGDINAYSRVQMALGDAKARAREEFQAALARAGHTLDDIRGCVAAQRELRRPLQDIAHTPGVVGRAANFVTQAARQLGHDPAGMSPRPAGASGRA